jgi:hypothetical protein
MFKSEMMGFDEVQRRLDDMAKRTAHSMESSRKGIF